jgi:hypothetical protein
MATVRDEGESAVLDMPPGPALERLSGDPVALQALGKALSAELGRTIRLRVEGVGTGPTAAPPPAAPRLTPERVRSDQLDRLASADPLLSRAVRDWDLELLD